MTLRSLARKLFAPAKTTPAARRPRLALQALEAREVPATINVQNLLDDGNPGSLRWAVSFANYNPGADEIRFANGALFATPQTIALSGPEITLSDTSGATTIAGPAAGVTIRGTGTSRIFNVKAGAAAAFQGLTLTNGGDSAGGAVYSNGLLTITQCNLTDNAASSGGAVYNDLLGTLTVAKSTLTGNSAKDSGDGVLVFNSGGGLFNKGSATLVNSTLTANKAHDFGGAVDNFGQLTTTHCTVVGNSATYYCGGLSNHGSGMMSAGNSLVLGNTSRAYTDVSGGFTDSGGNLIGIPTGFTLGQILAVDGYGKPLLADNGGGTRTVALAANSPALDAGLPTNTSDTTDQRGHVRSMNGRTDAGAFETQMVTTPDGARWFLGATGPGQDRYLYRQPVGGAPAAVDGYASRIGLAADGTVMVQNTGGLVFARLGSRAGTGSGWVHLSTTTTSDGATWLLGPDTRTGGDRRLYRWAAGSAISATDGWGNRIGTAVDGSVLHSNGYGGVYARPGSQSGTGSNWVQLATATAGDGAIWFLGPDTRTGGDRRIYRWATNGTLAATDGWAVSIWTATDGSILHRNVYGEVYARPGSHNSLGTYWVRVS